MYENMQAQQQTPLSFEDLVKTNTSINLPTVCNWQITQSEWNGSTTVALSPTNDATTLAPARDDAAVKNNESVDVATMLLLMAKRSDKL